MNHVQLDPPATQKELADIRRAIPVEQYNTDPEGYNIWIMRLIALRRGCQERFFSEAFNGDASGT